MKKDIELQKKKKKSNVGKTILFAVVLPIVLILVGVSTVFAISGKNIFHEASKLPVVGSFFPGEESAVTTEDLQRQINQLKATLSDEQAKVSDLEMLIEQKDQQIESLKREKEQLENEINFDRTELADEGERKKDGFSSIVKTYENMKPKNAAEILVSMDESTALNILNNMREKNVAAILEKMPSESAAKFTAELAKMQ